MTVARGSQALQGAQPGPARHFLTMGEVHCGTPQSVLTTVLGSCIAVCLWDRVQGLGGMNHFMLPHGPPPNARFGNVAIDRLVGAMLAQGCRRDALQAKIFGGAETFAGNGGGRSVGEQNTEVAISRLQHHGIPIVASSTGGRQGMVIHFDTGMGTVLLRRLEPG